MADDGGGNGGLGFAGKEIRISFIWICPDYILGNFYQELKHEILSGPWLLTPEFELGWEEREKEERRKREIDTKERERLVPNPAPRYRTGYRAGYPRRCCRGYRFGTSLLTAAITDGLSRYTLHEVVRPYGLTNPNKIRAKACLFENVHRVRMEGFEPGSKQMGNIFVVLTPLLHGLVKLAGLTPQTIEIEPGTLMNIWVPKKCVTKNDGKIVYVPPNKPAILLLHSFAMDGIFTWFMQVFALTRDYSVYVPDFIFFGGSITDRKERSTVFQAEFIAKGLGKLRVEEVTLVGVSYGGMVGFQMAKLYPKLVKSMVMSGTVIEMTESISLYSYKKLGLSSWSDLLMPKTVDELKIMFSVGSHKLPWLPNFIYRDIFNTMFTDHQKERNELLEALVVPDEDATLNIKFSQKIHMLWGDDDKIFDLDHAKTMRTQLGEKTTLDWIKDAGHIVPLEKAFVYNKRLKYVLERSCHAYDMKLKPRSCKADLRRNIRSCNVLFGLRKQMGNIFVVLTPLLHGLVKLAGLTPQTIEIEPGTTMNTWVPKEIVTKSDACDTTAPLFRLGWHFYMVFALTRDYSVYVPDFLFFGGSITDRKERSASFQAKFIAKGLEKLRVEKVTLVGMSYGGMVGFQMAKLYPKLVKSMVVSATVLEMTESISLNAYKKLGLSNWSDLLMPTTVDGLKYMFSVGFHKLPWLPDFIYRDILKTMFNNRKERNELLEALVVPDKDATLTNTNFSQTIHMLWGDDDKIFDLDFAMTMKTQLGEKTTLEWIKDAGHLVPLEQASLYNNRLKCVLQDLTKDQFRSLKKQLQRRVQRRDRNLNKNTYKMQLSQSQNNTKHSKNDQTTHNKEKANDKPPEQKATKMLLKIFIDFFNIKLPDRSGFLPAYLGTEPSLEPELEIADS
ncbi:hypothetical protein OSB04_030572 [Centaurea solstitialis]|uniref:AB hydrolase-1 domain-containing protein n=1 Tax=Centaurea solstitialis TaxID=347529 RepID=A0AA38S782_9ASTR|nr:hypothetical protein OSB04_030572 [Centaurea solstitialis]